MPAQGSDAYVAAMACTNLRLPLSLLMAPQAYRLDPQQPLGRQLDRRQRPPQ